MGQFSLSLKLSLKVILDIAFLFVVFVSYLFLIGLSVEKLKFLDLLFG